MKRASWIRPGCHRNVSCRRGVRLGPGGQQEGPGARQRPGRDLHRIRRQRDERPVRRRRDRDQPLVDRRRARAARERAQGLGLAGDGQHHAGPAAGRLHQGLGDDGRRAVLRPLDRPAGRHAPGRHRDESADLGRGAMLSPGAANKYDATVIEMRFPKGSKKGEGKIVVAGKASIDPKTGKLKLTNYSGEPVRLENITVEDQVVSGRSFGLQAARASRATRARRAGLLLLEPSFESIRRRSRPRSPSRPGARSGSAGKSWPTRASHSARLRASRRHRRDVAVADGRQRHEAEVDESDPRSIR